MKVFCRAARGFTCWKGEKESIWVKLGIYAICGIWKYSVSHVFFCQMLVATISGVKKNAFWNSVHCTALHSEFCLKVLASSNMHNIFVYQIYFFLPIRWLMSRKCSWKRNIWWLQLIVEHGKEGKFYSVGIIMPCIFFSNFIKKL